MREIHCKTWVELMETFDEWMFSYPEDVYFRGHSNQSWCLETALERHRQGEPGFEERAMLDHFSSRLHLFGADPIQLSAIDRLALLRHHGGPTNLIDWTRSPFIALYFAVADRTECDFAIYCVRKILFSSPVAYDQAVTFPFDPRGLEISTIVFSDMKGDRFQFLINGQHKITLSAEELVFGEDSFPIVVPLEPRLQNSRMHAQQGMFMRCLGLQSFHETLEHMAMQSPEYVCKIVVSKDLRSECETRLLSMNIHAASLFLDLDGLAKYSTALQAFDQRWRLPRK